MVFSSAVAALRAEPRAAGVPPVSWRDGVLVAAAVIAVVVESVLRPEVTWRPVATAVGVALAFLLLVRRSHPLLAVVAGFGVPAVLDVVALAVLPGAPVRLGTTAYVLVLVYALFRWGSGLQMLGGAPVVLLGYVVGVVRDRTPGTTAVLAVVVVMFPAALALAVRYRAVARHRQLDRARLRERERLARELHDTVAHHVSAIVIRAQAGQVVARHHPEAAVEALAVIEAEGARTLAEMRRVVVALRSESSAGVGGDDGVPLSPTGGLDDLARLAAASDGVPVHVRTTGDLSGLPPAVDAAAYRIAQEAVTNAVRHAERATRIDVAVEGGSGAVTVQVTDDGNPVAARNGRETEGFGILGMAERAALLGGTFHAGPAGGRGWAVTAVLPRGGAV